MMVMSAPSSKGMREYPLCSKASIKASDSNWFTLHPRVAIAIVVIIKKLFPSPPKGIVVNFTLHPFHLPHPHPNPPLEGEGIFKLALILLMGEGVGMRRKRLRCVWGWKVYNLVSFIFPQTPIFSPTMMSIPNMPSISFPLSRPNLISFFSFTTFPTAVAAASARAEDLERIQTASAFPKLREGPTVPEEVQMPRGVSLGEIMIPILKLRGELPA